MWQAQNFLLTINFYVDMGYQWKGCYQKYPVLFWEKNVICFNLILELHNMEINIRLVTVL
jgi:hypothetical protein